MTGFEQPSFAPEDLVLETVSGGGGLLLNVRSGILFELNGTGAFVWERALRGASKVEIVEALVKMFGISRATAAADVEATLLLPNSCVFPAPPTEYQYNVHGTGFRFSAGSIPIMEVSSSGRELCPLVGFNPAEAGVYLRAFTPKLLTVLGGSVLHASAVVRRDGRVIAFLGVSGAGKTTTARAFARTGCRLLCEDKLVVRLDGDIASAVVEGEPHVLDWIRAMRAKLSSSGTNPAGRWYDSSELAKALTGPALPIAEVMIIDHLRSRGLASDIQPLRAAEAAGEVFRHGFYGSPATNEWRRQVRLAAALGSHARIYSATMPEGIVALEAMARSYTAMTAS